MNLTSVSPLVHQNFVERAAFSLDGTRVATTGWDNTARICDSTTDRPLSPTAPAPRELSSAAFSPDGTRLVTANKDHSARVWYLPLALRSLLDGHAVADLRVPT